MSAAAEGTAPVCIDHFQSRYEKDLFKTRFQDPEDPHEETWDDVFARVAYAVSESPMMDPSMRATEEDAYLIGMSTGAFMPSSPQLANYGSGRKFNRNGSSCFTGRLGDTLVDFAEANSHAESIYVAAGGFGVCGNEARPRGCKIDYAKSGAVGVLGRGGPFDRIERTTGYITNGGRERGAAMLQLSLWHPDAVEFMLIKVPIPFGFLDDWPANVESMAGSSPEILAVIDLFVRWSTRKEWPTIDEVERETSRRQIGHGFRELLRVGAFTATQGRIIPQVYDWSSEAWRPANRDWSLPMQNCNMSVRVPDAFYRACEQDDDWVFSWFSKERPKKGKKSWTKIDLGGHLVVHDGDDVTFKVDEHTRVRQESRDYRYAVILTTWEGLRENLAPNVNNWKETEYARFYRSVILPHLVGYTGKIKARQVFDLLARVTWGSGEPGVVHEDTYERFNPVDPRVYGERLSNPCAEFVNPPGGSCNLVSVNLRLVAEGGRPMYLRRLSEATRVAFRYIAHASEYNEAPVPYIEQLSKLDFRTIGVGIMGLAEALMLHHIRYGSDEAIRFAAMSMAEVYVTCWEESFRLAQQTLGDPLKPAWKRPNAWNRERMIRIFERRLGYVDDYDVPRSIGDRIDRLIGWTRTGRTATHTAVTSVAPTGTIAQIAGWCLSRAASNGVPGHVVVTSGLEPTFSWAVGRHDNNGNAVIYHDLWAREGHHRQPWMVTAPEVTPEEHVRMQAAVCAFTCMSASKTVNLPTSATVDDVKRVLCLSHELSIPGTAIYRDASRPMQVLTALECPSGDCLMPADRAQIEAGGR